MREDSLADNVACGDRPPAFSLLDVELDTHLAVIHVGLYTHSTSIVEQWYRGVEGEHGRPRMSDQIAFHGAFDSFLADGLKHCRLDV